MSATIASPDRAWHTDDRPVTQAAAAQARVAALDGLRGLMMIFVLVSHYAAEVPHGLDVLSVGWVAVIVFFVLSGFLVGRLIIDKRESGNFLLVFYLRRVCRTFPTYLLTVAIVLAIAFWLDRKPWAHSDAPLPTWAYFGFVQNLFFITRQSSGLHWLSPTWTLALEEQFYLVAPVVFLAAPRRFWVPALLGLCGVGVAVRACGILTGSLKFAALALMPASMDVLCAGLLLATLVRNDAIDWTRWSLQLRVAPIVLLFGVVGLQRLDGGDVGPRFQILAPGLVALAAALLILMLIEGAPEARRFQSSLLAFFGRISYSVYLTHLAVLGLMHGLILDAEPDIGTPAQVAVTVASAAITIGLSWAITCVLEEPVTAWARTVRWSAPADLASGEKLAGRPVGGDQAAQNAGA